MNKAQSILVIAMGLLALVPAAQADEWNQKTIFTFSGPVEIPGQVLPDGTYVFKLADSPSDRHIVQVFSGDGMRLYGTFLAISDYRMKPSDQTIVKFEERLGGAPDAIKGWFYPGRVYGHQFVYPKKRAVELARTLHSNVPAMPTELTEDTTKPDVTLDGPAVVELEEAPLVAEEPNGHEEAIETVFQTTPLPPHTLPDHLPETATYVPLAALVGSILAGSGFAMRAFAKRSR
jgi:hypothetical protein